MEPDFRTEIYRDGVGGWFVKVFDRGTGRVRTAEGKGEQQLTAVTRWLRFDLKASVGKSPLSLKAQRTEPGEPEYHH